MLGGTLALAAGAHRRHGWPVVLTAAAAAALPDWDGLSLAFGPTAYTAAHRIWGHNVLWACELAVRTGETPADPGTAVDDSPAGRQTKKTSAKEETERATSEV